jgi:hypothetical protein
LQGAAERSFTPHQIVRSGRNSVQADLNRKAGEIQLTQSNDVFVCQEHGVGLEGKRCESKRTGVLQQIQPVRVTKGLSAGNAKPFSSDGSKLFHN